MPSTRGSTDGFGAGASLPACLAAAAAVVAAGCYGTLDVIQGDASTDSISDASVDSSTDTATDTGSDTGMDAGTDTSTDTGIDVPPDTGPDTIPDGIVDPIADTGPGECGGGLPVVCAPDEFCEIAAGVCDIALGYGMCVEAPTGYPCPPYWAPECGCDGVTYGNDCERRSARVQLLHVGECDMDPCAPWLDECPDGYTCEVPADSCDVIGVTGVCAWIRDDCGWLWDPQCACGGVTYANECERMAAGAWLDHWGECGEACGAPGSPPCSYSEFCEFPTGSCGAPGSIGECTFVPSGCPDFWAPVCGCDGVTYGNDCDRRAARAQLLHEGPC